MKDLISKIKTLDYKQFALSHGEKIGMGVVGLVVLLCLGFTNWASEYKREPRDLEEMAVKVDRDLKSNKWPEDKKKEFPYLMADAELGKVVTPIELAPYEWTVPFSPKLYPRQLPAEETDWIAVADLRVHSASMPMGVAVPPEDTADAEASDADTRGRDKKSKPEKSEKSGSKKKDRGDDLPPPSNPFGMSSAMGAMGDFGASVEKARGVRFNVVVGIIDLQQQHKKLRQALHLDSLAQAAGMLHYDGFRVQRQRAVPGPEPWSKDEKSWKDLDTNVSIEVLDEASDFDPEIVPAKYTNGELTSPLPHRLDGEWDPNIVAHRRIPTLTEDEQEQELIANKAAAQVAEEEAEEVGKRRGFSRIQKDANQLRSRATSTEGGAKKMQEHMAEMMKGMGAMQGDMAKRQAAEANARSRMMGPGGGHMGSAGMPMPPGMGMGMGGGMTGVAGDLADLVLFRYFDFDVEPGECYRYRVQLIVENPSFEETFVKDSAVAEGEFRETSWSDPSPPAVVESDVEYALAKMYEKGGRRDGAELNVVQFDTNVGTWISDLLKVAFGTYVGGVAKNSLHLDVAIPSFKEEDVTFSSKDLLIDSAGIRNLSASAVTDLNLTKELSKLTKGGELDIAVTLNRFGEIVELDSGSKDDLEAAKKRVADEREPYNEIKETAADKKKKKKDEEADDLFAGPGGVESPGKKGKKKGRVNNPLKSSMSAMMSGMMPGMPGMPGSVGTPPGKKSKGKSSR